MKSLLWKEFHEYAKWAAVPIVLFAGMMTVVRFGPLPWLGDTYLTFVSFIAAVFASTLGWVQFASESRGDRRAILLHRPVSRTRIFLAKALAGMTLYLAAMVIPLSVNAAWSAVPGQFAFPIHFQLILPWLADILTGLVYYFAGIFAAQQQGRWYGSRCLGFPAALFCSFLVWNAAEFGHALIAIVIFASLTALAAWGAFVSGGNDPLQSRLAYFAVAATFLMGLTVLSVTGKTIAAAMAKASESDGEIETNYELDRAGRLLVVHQRPGQQLRVTDPEGSIVEPFQRRQFFSRAELFPLLAPLSPVALPNTRSYRASGRLYVPCANESTPTDESWFFVHSLGRLVGYDRHTRWPIGTLGPDGFSPADEISQARFEGNLVFRSGGRTTYPVDYLAFPGGVFSVDFARRRVQRLFVPPVQERVLWASRWRDDLHGWTRAVVGTDRTVYVVDEAGQPEFMARLAYDPQTYGLVRFGRLDDPRRFVLWYDLSVCTGLAARESLPVRLVYYDGDGNEVSRTAIPPLLRSPSPRIQPWLGLLTPPAELAVLLGATRDAVFGFHGGEKYELRLLSFELFEFTHTILPHTTALRQGIRSGPVLLSACLVLLNAVVFAFTCGLLAWRLALTTGQCVGWTIGGLLLGATGLLLMFAIQPWPVRIACHACGRERRVDREHCRHCAAPHRPPAKDGTEIFERAANNGKYRQ